LMGIAFNIYINIYVKYYILLLEVQPFSQYWFFQSMSTECPSIF
jgi:hypothetical protein